MGALTKTISLSLKKWQFSMKEISANQNYKYVYEQQRPKSQFTGNVSSLCDVRVIISFSIPNIHRNFEKARKSEKILLF